MLLNVRGARNGWLARAGVLVLILVSTALLGGGRPLAQDPAQPRPRPTPAHAQPPALATPVPRPGDGAAPTPLSSTTREAMLLVQGRSQALVIPADVLRPVTAMLASIRKQLPELKKVRVGRLPPAVFFRQITLLVEGRSAFDNALRDAAGKRGKTIVPPPPPAPQTRLIGVTGACGFAPFDRLSTRIGVSAWVLQDLSEQPPQDQPTASTRLAVRLDGSKPLDFAATRAAYANLEGVLTAFVTLRVEDPYSHEGT